MNFTPLTFRLFVKINRPSINRQVKMINYGIQSNPIFIFGFVFENQNDTCLFAGLEGIVQTLANRLGPFAAEVEFNSVGTGHTVAPGEIRQNNFYPAAMISAPFILIPLFWVFSFCGTGRGNKKSYQDSDNKFSHSGNISETTKITTKNNPLTNEKNTDHRLRS